MRERLIANIPQEFAQVETKGRMLEGYASAFNYPIESGTRAHPQTTLVRPGAFTRTLKNNRDQIQVLFNHGHDPRYGELPIGTIKDLHEDKRGLKAQVELHDGPDNENIRAALASGALRAMSIQFEDLTPDAEQFNEDRSERYLTELKLWEFGPVTFPANEGAVATLHSLAALAVDLERDVTDGADSTEHQPEAPSAEARESTLDQARLTWRHKASRLLEQEDELLAAEAARMSM
jgi:HK97 family phage prohead protease